MPYIKQEIRKELDKEIDNLIAIIFELGASSVEPFKRDSAINYIITRIISAFYNKSSYEIMQRGIGVLECAKQEFYRRVMIPHEEQKKEENGDVY